MKTLLNSLLFFLFFITNGQDLIVRPDSSKIYCKITKQDSLILYYKENKTKTDSYIEKSQVLNYYICPSILDNTQTNNLNKSSAITRRNSSYTNYIFQKGDTLKLTKSNEFEFRGGALYDWEVVELMSHDLLASQEMKKAESCHKKAYGRSAFGGILAALPLKLSRGPLALAGFIACAAIAGVTYAITGPLFSKSKKHARRAVELFNANHR
jgi:hypothetical protein